MATTDRFHPAAPDGFALAAEEEFWPGIARLAVVQLETVVVALKGREALDEAVHQTRKATKRVRALLRLVRPTIGEGVYRRENRLLRDAARCLAPLRDDRVMVETVAVLRDGYAQSPVGSVFGELEQRLASRADRRAQVLIESGVVESAVATFEAALVEYRRWQMDPSTAVPIRVGVGAIYRRGREEMGRALAGC